MHADTVPCGEFSIPFLKGFHNHASHIRKPKNLDSLMFFSSVLDLLKCKSLPQHSRKAERDHVTSDARQITSAHPFLCLRFGGMVTKQLYDMETAQLEGCSHEFSHQVGR